MGILSDLKRLSDIGFLGYVRTFFNDRKQADVHCLLIEICR